MSKKFLYLGFVLACLVGAFVLVSCVVAKPAQLDGLIRAVQAAASDGVITPDELLVIQGQLPQPGFDWLRLVEAGGAIAGSILGVKLIPDRHLQSPFESAKPKES